MKRISGRMDTQGPGDHERRGARWSKRGLHIVVGLLLFNLGASVVVAQFRAYAVKPYRIPSSAMEPTLHCARPGVGCEGDTQDRVFVLRLHPFWTPRRGDIVAFNTPPAARRECGAGGTFVKRLIGLPGETVSQNNGSISVNGTPLRERYIKGGHSTGRSETWQVPRREYFFLGDNRAQSCDSRAFGSVPRGNLIGPVAAVYWPFDRIGSP